ncbi:MAG: MBL fold metallo-hydrolase [Bdellovibrionota bacterium]|nr:MBL fold metallo-hydrolase [Bdellovibrionota bacterium]
MELEGFKIHELRGYIQSMYLVEYSDKLLLLDSGTKLDVQLVRDFITKELKRDFLDLKLVLISHAHPDHSGGAAYFQKLGIPIAGPHNINNWYRGLSGFITYHVDISLLYMVWTKVKKQNAKLRSVYFPRHLKLDFELRELERIPGFEDWQSLHTDGHTESDLSFYNKKNEFIYIADNVVRNRKGFLSPYPVVFPEKYKMSLTKYLQLPIQYFAIAHYGIHNISKEQIQILRDGTGSKPRRHRTSLGKILFGMLFRKSKKRLKTK